METDDYQHIFLSLFMLHPHFHKVNEDASRHQQFNLGPFFWYMLWLSLRANKPA